MYQDLSEGKTVILDSIQTVRKVLFQDHSPRNNIMFDEISNANEVKKRILMDLCKQVWLVITQ